MKLPCLVLVSAFWLSPLIAQDRMPPIPADKQTAEQKKAIEQLGNTRGADPNTGPFAPLLRSPDLMSRLSSIGDYMRTKKSLSNKLSEMIAIMIARELTQDFLWDIHYPNALRNGLSIDAATAIAQGRHPDKLADDEETVYSFVSELLLKKSVSDPTYARMVSKFGEQGAVDAVGVAGYYMVLGLEMNMAHTPGQPNGTAPAPKLAPFPR